MAEIDSSAPEPNSEPETPQEKMRQALDAYALTEGIPQDGYSFDDLPFDGVHLVYREGVWHLYILQGNYRTSVREFNTAAEALVAVQDVLGNVYKSEDSLQVVADALQHRRRPLWFLWSDK
jgi:hypothetical protein